jgi:Domain of unknown function (DUF4249)
MKKIHIFQTLIILAVFLAVTSCQKDFFNKTIELDDSEYEKKMVMYCFLNQVDTVMRVSVSRNYGLSENVNDSAYFLPKAQLKLTEQGGFNLSNFVYVGRSFFQPKTPPVPRLVSGNTYTIEASTTDLTPISAQVVMPSAIAIDTSLFVENAGTTQFGDQISRVEIQFKDTNLGKDYYLLRVLREEKLIRPIYDQLGNIISSDTSLNTFNLYPEQPFDPAGRNGLDGEIVLSDELFNGQNYRVRFNFYNYNNQNSDDVYILNLSHITEDEYLYRVSERQRQDNEDIPLVEPQVVHTNIKNGIGVFALSHIQTIRVKI